jgi:hypothetical protein
MTNFCRQSLQWSTKIDLLLYVYYTITCILYCVHIMNQCQAIAKSTRRQCSKTISKKVGDDHKYCHLHQHQLLVESQIQLELKPQIQSHVSWSSVKCYDIFEMEEYSVYDYLRLGDDNIVLTDGHDHYSCSKLTYIKDMYVKYRDDHVFYQCSQGHSPDSHNPLVKLSTSFGDFYVYLSDLKTLLKTVHEWNLLTLHETTQMSLPLISGPASRGEPDAYIGSFHCQESSKCHITKVMTNKISDLPPRQFRQSVDEQPTQPPTHVFPDGTQQWLDVEGLLHRDNDLPAIIKPDGTHEWFSHGMRHRNDGQPAIMCGDGTQIWYVYDNLHRSGDLPAVILSDGTNEWFIDGLRHRDSYKPAVIYPTGVEEYWFNGIRIHEP